MYVEFLLEDGPALSQTLVTCSLPDLSFDLKRMLRIQWKEFLHYLEEGAGDRTQVLLKHESSSSCNSF
ncbi:MAG: hypothetical protein HY711_03480 [Candidatus Melainabacteria bacterium]|nr:hypothetical protein [Candidatus Melainabacteria bacterium]